MLKTKIKASISHHHNSNNPISNHIVNRRVIYKVIYKVICSHLFPINNTQEYHNPINKTPKTIVKTNQTSPFKNNSIKLSILNSSYRSTSTKTNSNSNKYKN